MINEDEYTPTTLDKNNTELVDFNSVQIESNEFTLEELSQMPNY